MAMSAFRSTTRRNCQIGGYSSSAEGGGVPSTARSKRDPSPSPSLSGRGSHRRSVSGTDFSSRYLSDCSSTSEFRSSYNKGSKTGRHSVCPSDSESDMDSLSTYRPCQWDVESEDERPTNSSALKPAFITSEHKGLRRMSSNQELLQTTNNTRQHVPVLGKKTECDNTDKLVEEKTIRAVFAQIKSLHSDPPVGDVGMADFLDAMRAEVGQAVSDIRMELEKSRVKISELLYLEFMQKNGKLSLISGAEKRSESHGTDVLQAVADIRKEYTTKLEESERRVGVLWSQIAMEERRCLELSKIVKELLPTQPPAVLLAQYSSNRRRPIRRKNSTERQPDLRSLEDEAQRYFKEHVSISSLDFQGDSDDSVQGRENSSKHKSSKELHKKSSSYGSDGVVLPWLQWEAEAGAGCDKNLKQVEKIGKGTTGKSSAPHRLDGSSTHSKSKTVITAFAELGKPSSTTLALSTWSGNGVLEITSEVPDFKQTTLFALDNNRLQKESIVLDVDLLLFEKIKFRRRVENGELFLCQGRDGS